MQETVSQATEHMLNILQVKSSRISAKSGRHDLQPYYDKVTGMSLRDPGWSIVQRYAACTNRATYRT